MRILIVSDIHANLVALNAVLERAGSFDRIWCLGDIVGYGPEPNECIEKIKSYDTLSVAGNHDWAALGRLDLDEFNPDARFAALWTRDQLKRSNLEWLGQLPERVPPQLDRFTLVHASPRYPIWEYVLTPAVARTNFDHFDTPFCLLGHTHIPTTYRYSPADDSVTVEPLLETSPLQLGAERMIVNPGSVGQPRDGDPRAAFALLDSDTLTLTHTRVSYDIHDTQAKMSQAHLPPRLISRLSYGW